ncbi:MAG: DUF4440 domain-containing protein [Betaproteobacteria bacterium]|nr:DUF4440 domain-containing protein [Betaproteobacteria bacterium]
MTLPRHQLAALALVLTLHAPAFAQPDLAVLREQVFAAERAFAKTMADRDHAAFTRHVAEDAVFFTGSAPLRGHAAVTEGWKRFFEGPEAPFSWEPQDVEVLASGQLAHSSGPVRDRNGKIIARFNSVWRQEAPGVWRAVFDKGSEVCNASTP